jgi:hypothetical protein
MKKTIILSMLLAFLCTQIGIAQNTLAQISDKMESLGDKMEGLGTIMEKHGGEMEKYGKKIEKNPNDEDTSQKMSSLGDEMSKLGDEMSVMGDEMTKYGDEMGIKHEAMMQWFFEELKKDGLVALINGNMKIDFQPNGLTVNGKKADSSMFDKYKNGFEKHWGRALKSDFLFHFSGKVSNKNGKIETDGTMSNEF